MPFLIGKVKAFGARERFFKIGFLPTWIMLGAARAAVLLFQFAGIVKYLGVHVTSQDIESNVAIIMSNSQINRARQVSRLVINTARYCPWNANCFAQAIVARILLGWFGLPYRLYFGLRREDTELKAHAWVCSGQLFVTGSDGFKHHTVVGCYCCAGCGYLPKVDD